MGVGHFSFVHVSMEVGHFSFLHVSMEIGQQFVFVLLFENSVITAFIVFKTV